MWVRREEAGGVIVRREEARDKVEIEDRDKQQLLQQKSWQVLVVNLQTP